MKKNILYIGLLLATIAGCKKEEHSFVGPEGETPGKITNVVVENLHGSAKLTYTLPDNDNVLYVIANYEMRKGVTREVKASYYNNFMLLEGFADTLAHAVKVTVVSKSGKTSEPVTVTVNPLTPPYIMVFRSLNVKAALGGIDAAFVNSEKAEIGVIVNTIDTTKIYGKVGYMYTSLDSGMVKVRGFDTSLRKFDLYVTDKWGNVSDTLSLSFNPLFSRVLDAAEFRELKLEGDVESATDWGDMSISKLWDGDSGGWNFWHSDPNSSFPMSISFDLGQIARVGLIKMWQRRDDDSYMYAQNNVKHLEIYGRADAPTDGSWDGWTLLSDYTLMKPSGLPVGQLTQADKDAVLAGEEIRIVNGPEVRYIRLKIIESWQAGNTAANIAEMEFWEL